MDKPGFFRFMRTHSHEQKQAKKEDAVPKAVKVGNADSEFDQWELPMLNNVAKQCTGVHFIGEDKKGRILLTLDYGTLELNPIERHQKQGPQKEAPNSKHPKKG